MAFFPGYEASITIGGTAKPLDAFEISVNGNIIDTSNFTSGGWAENYQGLKDADITASGPYNGIASGAAASDAAGTSVAFVLDFGGTGPTLTITARIETVKIGTQVRDVGKINYTAKSNGVPTLTY